MRLGTCLCVAALAAGCSAIGGHGRHDAPQGDYCAQYRAEAAGKSPEERRQAAEAHILRMHGSVDPGHVERHLAMMERRCGSASPSKPGSG